MAAFDAAGEEAEHLLARITKVIDERREADHNAYAAALGQVEERRQSDFAALRTDLDTVAVNADDGLSRAQEKLIELATLAKAPGN